MLFNPFGFGVGIARKSLFDASELYEADPALTPLFLFRQAATPEAGNVAQGCVFDDRNRHAYVCRRITSDTSTIISRFSLDGHHHQAALDNAPANGDLGHQALTIEYGAADAVKLWTESETANTVCRFTYDTGGIDDIELYQLFDSPDGDTVYTAPTISYCQKWLVARGLTTGGDSIIAVFDLAALVAGGPGDHSGTEVARWTLPVDYLEASTFPLQQMAVMEGRVYIFAGNSGVSAVAHKLGVWTLTGREVYTGDAYQFGKAQADIDGAYSANRYCEPEGLGFFKRTRASDASLALLISSGAQGDAAQMPRIYILDAYRTKTSDDRLDEIEAIATLTSGTRARYKDILDDFITYDLLNKLGLFYPLTQYASDGTAVRSLNILDPARHALTEVGGLTFDTTGVVGNGSTGYLTPGIPWYYLPGGTQNIAHVGVQVVSTAATVAPVIGTLAGGYTFLYPRDGSDRVQHRMNCSTPTTNTTGVTDASGHWVLNRDDPANYTIYRNNTGLATPTAASTSLSLSNVTLLQNSGIFSTAKIKAVSFGYKLDSTDRANLASIIAARL